MKVKVTLTEQIGRDPVYWVLGENDMSSIKCFTFKTDCDADDPVWGQATALRNALAFAKDVEKYGLKKKETVIYETPNQETE